ncbi:MAG TPA: hypothetical protein VGB64_03730 [Actinomycetota bacterium]
MRPRGLDFWTESAPPQDGWPDASCGYVLLSEGYRSAAEEARAHGWPVVEISGAAHFHLLIDPDSVANEIHRMFVSFQHPTKDGN